MSTTIQPSETRNMFWNVYLCNYYLVGILQINQDFICLSFIVYVLLYLFVFIWYDVSWLQQCVEWFTQAATQEELDLGWVMNLSASSIQWPV